ncbi:MAG: hypothetical protein U1F58_14505 [Burkholderiales bacterium]
MMCSALQRLDRIVRHVVFTTALALGATLLPVGAVFAVPLLDGNDDFKLMAWQGFEQAIDGAHAQGTVANDYAWSMAWFKGKLYVGTGQFSRDSSGLAGAGQIWAYTPGGADGASGTWSLAFESPGGVAGAREFGYRWMTTCTFRGTEYLFVSTAGPLQGNILYSADGRNFQPTSRSGFPVPTVGFRTAVCFTEPSGRTLLVTTPVGKAGTPATYDSDKSDNPVVLVNDDPTGGGAWRQYSPMRMGDNDNNVFFAMTAHRGWLYAGVYNEVTGAQLWRTRGCASIGTRGCTPSWIKVIDRGGGRPPLPSGEIANTGFADMIGYGDDLYVVLSRPALQLIAVTAELWRLRSDGTFEVLIGMPRNNVGSNPAVPANLYCGVPLEDIDGNGGANDCPPTTRRGAGFGDVGSAQTGYPDGVQYYFWRLYNYGFNAVSAPLGDDRLYMGTLQGPGGDASTFGFDLLATSNGVDWTTVSNNGIGNWQQQGMRSIAASPYGLFVGGTHFTVGYAGEIRGCDVWLGMPAPDGLAPATTISSPPSPTEGATVNSHSVGFAWAATDTPAPGSLPITYAYRLDPLEPAFSSFATATTKTYQALPNGAYTFFVIARDAAGNVEAAGAAPGAPNRRAFSVDAPDLPPSTTITTAPASPWPSGTAQFTWSGSDDLTPVGSLQYAWWLEPLQADPGTFAGTTTATYTGLANGAYTFHVKARDGAGNVGAEATRPLTVAIPPTPPAAPAPATAVLQAARIVRIAWTDVVAEQRYEIDRCVAGGRSCNFMPLVTNIAADTTMYNDALAAAGTYGYRVRACNANGCSSWVNTPLLAVP